MAAMSLPASDSDAQNAASLTSPGSPNIWGSHSSICSRVPVVATDTAARVDPTSESAIPGSPQNNSSKATGMPSPDASRDCCAKKSSEYKPILDASSMIGHGVSSRSSHSAAAGLMALTANSCTQSRMSRRCSLSSSENGGGLWGSVLIALLGAWFSRAGTGRDGGAGMAQPTLMLLA